MCADDCNFVVYWEVEVKMDDVSMLNKAVIDEIEAVEFYRKMSCEASDMRVRELAHHLLREELQHQVELQVLVNKLSGIYVSVGGEDVKVD